MALEIDAQFYPVLHKAWTLEKELNQLRSSPEYQRDLFLFFGPPYTPEQLADAEKQIAKYQETHEPCTCDGGCRSAPFYARKVVAAMKEYTARGKALGIL